MVNSLVVNSLVVSRHLDVDEVCDEGHEDHLLSVPALAGVHLYLPLQLPSLAAVPHEDLRQTTEARGTGCIRIIVS